MLAKPPDRNPHVGNAGISPKKQECAVNPLCSGIWGQLYEMLASSLKVKEEQTTGIWCGLYLNRQHALKIDNL